MTTGDSHSQATEVIKDHPLDEKQVRMKGLLGQFYKLQLHSAARIVFGLEGAEKENIPAV